MEIVDFTELFWHFIKETMPFPFNRAHPEIFKEWFSKRISNLYQSVSMKELDELFSFVYTGEMFDLES